jgi:uracil-DNA glycosylase
VVVILLVQTDLSSLLPFAWRSAVDLKTLIQISEKLGFKFLPDAGSIFKALECAPADVKVVIVGQDPYPNSKHAMGLAFSVPADVKVLPASLQNIYSELKADLGVVRENGDLSEWSNQGVLLLNVVLTIVPNKIRSHSKIGWQAVTEQIVKDVAQRGALAILWGSQAQQMSKYFAPEDQFTAPHPSPLSAYRGFYGSRPFSKVNKRLLEKGLTPIKW